MLKPKVIQYKVVMREGPPETINCHIMRGSDSGDIIFLRGAERPEDAPVVVAAFGGGSWRSCHLVESPLIGVNGGLATG